MNLESTPNQPDSSAPSTAVAATTNRDTALLAAKIAREVGLAPGSVTAIIRLLDEGSTIPFIARYRKEATGGAEDTAILQTMERLHFHRELEERRQVVLDSIEKQGSLRHELRAAIERAETRAAIEDLYLPYRPKRRTRATIAREKGLEPLAERMWAQQDRTGDPEEVARAFVDPEKGVATVDEALLGAKDIVAEWASENAGFRSRIRDLTRQKGRVFAQAAKGKAGTTSKFSDYYDFGEPVSRIPSHRILAILRGEKEGFLSQRIEPDPVEAKSLLGALALSKQGSIWRDRVQEAVEDAYDRLLQPQIATELRAELKEMADREAIEVFARSVRALLMAPPLGALPVMAIDPGFRTGCKVVVLSATGSLLDHGVVFPTEPRHDLKGTEAALDRWFAAHPDLAAIAIGNGTGGRETFQAVRGYIEKRGLKTFVILVNESGASIYSASDVAREEFPDQDVTVRGAVSIGRRMQDPLAELVKIDPKSIGVGQYQHDVDQKLLKQKLEDVVVSCVNRVGVDVNTASASLLRHVSGLGPKLAKEIAAERDKIGGFRGRRELLAVAGMGPKTFEQAAGFLRVKRGGRMGGKASEDREAPGRRKAQGRAGGQTNGGHPLDDSAVHPERYALVERMAADLGRKVEELIGDGETLRTIDLNRYIDAGVGLFTLRDIIEELEKPGRDPRRNFEAVVFSDEVREIEDLRPGMILNGTVTNVTDFGAFVDIGVHQDGLVHVSQIANRFVRNPADELHVGQVVRVKVVDIDLERRRIGLTMKDVPGSA
jgi:protein Tex